MKNIIGNIRLIVPSLLLVVLSFYACGDEKADSEDCRAVCRMIKQCEPEAYVTETRLEACYAGCDKGSIYLKKEYSVCVAESGSCDDFEACLLAVDSGEYDAKNGSGN